MMLRKWKAVPWSKNVYVVGPCLYESGLVPERLTYLDDVRCPSYGIGLTNMVERTTRGSADLSRLTKLDW